MTDGARVEPRPLEEILPGDREAARSRDMQATWQAFCLERSDMVRRVLEGRRSPPEIAYQLGELIHTYFRPRGLSLTSLELRRLVAELLDTSRRGAAKPAVPQAPIPTGQENPPVAPPSALQSAPPSVRRDEATEARDGEEVGRDPPSPLVSFRDKPDGGQSSWTGDERPVEPPTVPDATFEPPASPLVAFSTGSELGAELGPETGSELGPELGFQRLLARTLDLVRPRLATSGAPVGREEAVRAIEAALDEVLRTEEAAPSSADVRQQVVLVALSEVCGLGLIDRLWADHSVRAVFVNGPTSVFVEREGGLAPAAEVFRDQAQLLELVDRLVERPANGVAEFQLRDGGVGTVVFPPAAPDGPVLTLRRAEPGAATLGRLIAADVLDQKVAALLRVAVRAHLKILVLGEAGSGKTALLAALGRDLDAATRIITIARHREFRWTAPAKVELVASREQAYGTLLGAAENLRPQVLILDSLRHAEAGRAAALAARATHATLTAAEPSVPTAELIRSTDLRVRLGRGRDGLFRIVAVEDATGAVVFAHEEGHFRCRLRTPAFVEKIRTAGYGEALAAVLR